MNTYLITGAAQGLGQHLTYQLAKDNNQLILLDKDLKTLNFLYDDITANDDLKADIALFPMDLLGANIEHYQQLQDALTENYGELDGVFLAAATLPAFTPIEHFDFEQWYEVLHTNLNANFHLIQKCLPLLRKKPESFLTAILDNNIESHPAYYGAYGVAKAGLEQLMKTTAMENKQTGIRFYNAKLDAFQSNTRSRQFPSEDPSTIPTGAATAEHLLTIVLDDLEAELIEKL